jgi:hypothetical protein
MNKKNWIRCIVLVGLLAWPGVETLRYLEARKQLEESITRQRAVSARLAYLKQIQAPLPLGTAPETTPISNSQTP